MTDQNPTPYGDPDATPTGNGPRDLWGPPSAEAAQAPETPWWSSPQSRPDADADADADADGDGDADGPEGPTAPLPDYPTTPGGAAWGPPAAPAGGDADATAARSTGGATAGSEGRRLLRTAVVVALVAGLVGGGLGAAGVALYDHSGGKGGTITGTTATLQQVTDTSAKDKRPAGSVAAIAAAALPSVVTIKETSGSTRGTGSGVVIDGANGFILTNNHVVADVAAGGSGGTLQVIPAGGSSGDAVDATVVGTDPRSDLAVIKTGAKGLVSATLGRSADLVVGDQVIAIGAPLGLSGTVTQGIVSALNRVPEVPGENGNGSNIITGAIQTDAAINPGNSGGALLDSNGRVIGINTAIASPGASAGGQAGNIGIGFAIPIDFAAPIARELITTGKASHPYIGVSVGQDRAGVSGARIVAPIDPVTNEKGAAVVPGSPADRAGLREGDVVTAVDGQRIAEGDQLVAAIRQKRVGDKVTITYQRGGSTRTAELTLQDNPAGPR